MKFGLLSLFLVQISIFNTEQMTITLTDRAARFLAVLLQPHCKNVQQEFTIILARYSKMPSEYL